MAHITLSIPDKVYRRMKEYSEIKWSDVARKAILEYLNTLKGKSTSREVREMLSRETIKTLKALPEERAKGMYKEMEVKEWKRMKSLTRTS